MTHALKTWPEFFKSIESGDKPFEVRKADRPFKINDTLLLQEFNNEKQEYTGKEWEGTITYILEGGEFGVKKGYSVLGIKEKSNQL